MIGFNVSDRDSAAQDLLASCHAAIYAYGVIAAYLSDADQALDRIAIFRNKRDELLAWCANNGLAPIPARAAYQLDSEITDDATAKALGVLLEDRACAHWSQALFYLPPQLQETESKFLQTCAIRSFEWSGLAKPFFAG